MKKTPVIRAGAFVLGIACLASPAFSSVEDCNVERLSGQDEAREPAGAQSSDRRLSQRLSTCASVLDPPHVGDLDIVEPTPKTNDPINIHPGTPRGTRP